MIIEVKERKVEVECDGRKWEAVVMDGKVERLDYPYHPDYVLSVGKDRLHAYITFLEEVIEAIKQTEK